MTLRPLTVPLALAMVAGLAAAQDEGKAARKTAGDRAEAKAVADAEIEAPAKAKAKRSVKAKAKTSAKAKARVKTERATFGGGCFWCLEAVFERVPGVKSVVSGYAGGNVPRPSYEMVQTGLTGHAEVVQVEFDPEAVSYEELLDIFWHSHDPTSLNRQGPDEGTEYRSIILCADDDQMQAARKSFEKLRGAGIPVVTEVVPLARFYPAERYHQNFYRNHRADPYCQSYIIPKLMKLRQHLAENPPRAKKTEEADGDKPAKADEAEGEKPRR